MKPHAYCAALVTLLTVAAAHAEPVVAHASFSTTATLEMITRETCGLRPALTTSKTRRVAVTVGDRTCSTNGPPTGVTLVVRLFHTDDGGRVALDATAPDDVSREDLQALVDESAAALKTRVAAPRHGPLFTAGIATTAAGAIMEVFGLGLEVVSLFKGQQLASQWCTSCEDHVGEMVATGLLLGSLVTIVVGTQLIRVGKSNRPQVTASLSPTGGSFRVTF